MAETASLTSPQQRRVTGDMHSPQSYDSMAAVGGTATVLNTKSPVKHGFENIEGKFEATGSLLPQPYFNAPLRVPPSAVLGGAGIQSAKLPGSDAAGEVMYPLSTIRKIHAIVLQSALDLSFGTALERVVAAAKTITNSRHAQIFFLEKAPNQPGGLNVDAVFGLRLKGRGAQDKVFPAEGLAGICALENMAVLSNRPHHDARFNPDIDWAPGSGVKSVACAPMTNLAGKVVGVIQVSNKVQGTYTEEDAHFLSLLATQAAVTFDLCVKNDLRQTQIRKTTAMLKGFVKLAGKSSAAELAHKSGLLCKEVCGAAQASCFLMVDARSGLTSWSKVSDGKADVFTQQKVPIKGFLAEVLNFKGSSLADDSAEGGQVRQHLGTLYCPIVFNGKAQGVLQARGSRKGQFSDVDADMLRSLSSFIAVLHNSLVKEEVSGEQGAGAWDSIASAVGDIDKTVCDGFNCLSSVVLFVDHNTRCFWTIHPKGSNDYLRLPMETFPLSWVETYKTLLSYPAPEKEASVDENAFSANEVTELRALAKKFLPNMKMECLLACPLMGSAGECVAVLVMINKHKASGPFEPWVGKSALSLSAKWGPRLDATLIKEVAKRKAAQQAMLYTVMPDLFASRPKPQMLFLLCKFVAEFLFCDRCLIFLVTRTGSLILHSDLNTEPIQLDRADAGSAGVALQTGRPVVMNHGADNVFLERTLKFQIHSALALSIERRASSAKMPHRVQSTQLSRQDALIQNVSAVVMPLNKLGPVDKFSAEDERQLQLLVANLGRIMDTNQSLLELDEMQREMQSQGQQRNLIVEKAALLHRGALLQSVSTPSGLVSGTRDLVKSVLKAGDCVIFLAANGGNGMYEMSEDFSAHAYIEDAKGIVGHVIRSGNVIRHSDFQPNENFDETVDQRVVKRAESILCVPLLDPEGQPVGAIELLNSSRSEEKEFQESDAQLMQQIAMHVYFAILNTSLLTKLHSCSERLTTVSPEDRSHDSVPAMGKFLQHISSAEHVNIFVREGMSFKCVHEFSGQEIEIMMGQGFVGRCAQSQEISVVHQMLKDPNFNPRTDQRDGMTITQAMYVPIVNLANATTIVVEVLNKNSGAFDVTDEVVAKLVGLHAHAILHQKEELVGLEAARTQALSLLTSVQYLYPYTGGTSDILHSAISQLSIVMNATARIFLAMFNEDGQQIDDLWKCYEKSAGSPHAVPIEGVSGTCFRNVAPELVRSQDVRDLSGAELNETPPEGATQSSAFLCQPLMDNVNKRPVGVIEFRRAEKIGSNQPIEQFTDFDMELAYQVSILIVHSMVHHSKTWSVKETADELRKTIKHVKFPD